MTFEPKRSKHAVPTAPILAISRDKTCRLSISQELALVPQLSLDIRGAKHGAPLLGFGLTIEGNLDRTILSEALQAIVARHEILRTGFAPSALVGNFTVQGWAAIQQVFRNGILKPMLRFDAIIVSATEIPLNYEDIRSLAPSEQEAVIDKNAVLAIGGNYAYERPPLARAVLLRTGDATYKLMIGLSHLVFDAWSTAILWRELATLYQAFSERAESPLTPLKIQYLDFAHWQRQQLQGERLKQLLNYWENHYSVFPHLEASALPFSNHRKTIPKTAAQESRSLDLELCRQIRDFAASTKTTLYMLFLLATTTALFLYSGKGKISVASYFANRGHIGIQDLIGYFATAHRIGIDFSEGPSILELLSQVRMTVVETIAHQDIPTPLLMNLLSQSKGKKLEQAGPWITCEFVSYRPTKSLKTISMHAMSVRERLSSVPPPQPLRFICRDRGASDIRFSIHYHSDLFEKTAIETVLESVGTILKEAIHNPNRPVADLSEHVRQI
jgi:hypothetical protein